MLSFLVLLLSFNAVVAGTISANSINIRPFIDQFFVEKPEDTIVPAVKSNLRVSKLALLGYAEFWTYSDDKCSIVREVLSIKINECVEVADNRWAKIRGVASPQFSMQIEYFSDRSCGKKIKIPLSEATHYEECGNIGKNAYGKLMVNPILTKSINHPSVGYALYGSADQCEKNLTEDAKMTMITPLDVCQYSGFGDFIFTECTNSELQTISFKSTDGTCRGEPTPTIATHAAVDCQAPTKGGSFFTYYHLD